jgi:hypothetical protein
VAHGMATRGGSFYRASESIAGSSADPVNSGTEPHPSEKALLPRVADDERPIMAISAP